MPWADFDGRVTVVDASVVVRWIVPEEGAAEALGLLGRPIDWVAPRLLVTEVASALHRKTQAREVSAEFSARGLDFLTRVIDRGALKLQRDEALVRMALSLAVDLQHKVADCLYLALAEQTGTGLATADSRLGRLAQSRNVPCLAIPCA